MSILEGYRDADLAKKLQNTINRLSEEIGRRILIMHVCGSHEWTITHHGVRSLLPDGVEVRAGPGCPVCVTPAADIDAAVGLALDGKVILTYGDMSRAKGSKQSLAEARTLGGDVRVVYSVHDAVKIATSRLDKEFIFFAVGFETTAPATAYEILQGPPSNLRFLTCYRYVPSAVETVSRSPDFRADAFINAGHASTVTGMKAYKPCFDECHKPMVFSGFEPLDVLISIAMILRQIRNNEPKMENEYTRSVTWDGNLKAQDTMWKAFNLQEGYWRGVAMIPNSALDLKAEFSELDAREHYELTTKYDSPGFARNARCADVIIGKIDPPECPLYMRECTPGTPLGPTMVSSEGTCKIWADHKIISTMRCRV
ncbi:MAG TPA: hydrogenase formation protein HypD [Candidatus Acidoferrum sp.]|nr:hydrogenase formation protein HypD [Candidatus Acidoferrum sp.]